VINLSRGCGSWGNLAPRIFDAANEIANNLDLVGVIWDFNVGELIFNEDQQFQEIKPIGPEIATEVRFVLDATDVDAEMFGDKRANVANVQAFPRRSLSSVAVVLAGHDRIAIGLKASNGRRSHRGSLSTPIFARRQGS
jgi:hypothetical protein